MKYVFMLMLVPSLAMAQVDTRIIDTTQSRGNPIVRMPHPEQPPVQPPRRPDMERPPIGRPLPPMPPMGYRMPATREDCLSLPPMLRDVCFNRGVQTYMPPQRYGNTRIQNRIRNASPQQRRAIEQARKEFRAKVERILRNGR